MGCATCRLIGVLCMMAVIYLLCQSIRFGYINAHMIEVTCASDARAYIIYALYYLVISTLFQKGRCYFVTTRTGL